MTFESTTAAGVRASARQAAPPYRGRVSSARESSPRAGDEPLLAGVDAPPRGLVALWTLVRRTVVEIFHDRVTGLAAEAAFYALLSLPPLALALVGTLGYLQGWVGADNVLAIKDDLVQASRAVLSADTVDNTVRPILDQVLAGGRADVVSIGFLLSLYAGSRAMNVYVDTITIAYDLAGRRGIVRTRLLAFALYLAGVVVGLVVLPLLVVGPSAIDGLLDGTAGQATRTLVGVGYWPVVLLLSVAFLTSLYHFSVPVRTPWRRDVPGAVLALVVWVAGSALLRIYLGATIRGNSTYGSLAAPIAVLLWLYVTGLAILIGAELNAEVDKLWPSAESDRARRVRQAERRRAAERTAVTGEPADEPPEEARRRSRRGA